MQGPVSVDAAATPRMLSAPAPVTREAPGGRGRHLLDHDASPASGMAPGL